MSQRLKKNDVITINGSEMLITNLDPTRDEVTFFTPKTQTTSSMSIKELRQQLASGEARTSAPAVSHGLLQDFETKSAASDKFLFYDKVLDRIKGLVRAGRTTRDAIKIARESPVTLATGETVPMCSERQAYRLMDRQDDHKICIMPAYSARGNRVPRYGDRMKEITLEVLEDEYGKEKSRFSLGFVATIVTVKARAEGILAKDRSVSRKYVRSILLNHWNSDLDHKRIDQRIAKSAKAVAKNRIKPGAPLNRVEIDGLHLPFIVAGDKGIIEDIWLLHAIDCDTSNTLGWWLTCTQPTTDDTFSCLERAIYPKTELLKSMGVNSSVDPFGLIMNLVMDNGTENSKARMVNLTKLGINLQWTEINSGHRKPFIERKNGSLKRALESLPGCTRFNGKDGERKAEARNDSLMTLGELEHWIVRWFFEVWAHKPLERFITAEFEIDDYRGATPAERWENYERLHSLPICPTREDWRRVRFLESTGKLCAKTGISYDSFTFRGNNLPHLIEQYGPSSAVQFFYNPHDFRIVYVPDKKSGNWVELVNSEVGNTTPAYSFDLAKQRRAAKKAAHQSSPFRDQFTRDIVERSTRKATQKQAKEVSRKASDAHERDKQAQARADRNPMTEQSDTDPNFDTYVAADAIEKLAKHKKTERTSK